MWKSLEAEENDIQPTPCIGWPVQYLPSGDEKNPKAATVVAIEGAGRLTLSILEADQFPKTKKGVHYLHHPMSKKGSPHTARCGTWRYVPDMPTPKSHSKVHQEIIDRKHESLKKAAADQQKAEDAAAESKGKKQKQEPAVA